MKIRIYLIFILFVGVNWISAQTPEWFNFTNGDLITAIAQHNDTLWVGTTCGLVKLNKTTGQTLGIFTSANSGLPNVEITDIVITSNGIKWIGTQLGLVKFDGSTWTIYGPTQGLFSSISTLTIDNNDMIYAGSPYDGLAYYNIGGDNFTSINTTNTPDLPSNQIFDMAYDTLYSRLWVATANGLAQRSFDGIWQVWNDTTGLPNNQIVTVGVDANSIPWAGTMQNGLAQHLDGNQWILYQAGFQGFPSNNIRCINFDGQDIPWVGTADGGLTNYQGTSWVVYSTSNSNIPDNSVRSVFVDNLNDKWIGTNKGLAKFSGTAWTTSYSTSNSELPNPLIHNMASRSQAPGLWINTTHDVALYDGTNWTIYNSLNSQLPAVFYSGIFVDASNNLFVGTEGAGGYRLSGTTWTSMTTTNSSIPSNYILTGDIDSNGFVWVGTDNGLAKFTGTDWISYNTQNSEIQDNYIPKIKADRAGNLWLASEILGLSLFNTVSLTLIPAPTGLPVTYVLDMVVDNQNNLWVASDQGLWVLEDQSWQSYTTDNSQLPTDIIRAVDVSIAGNIWIGTSQGLVQFTPADTNVYTVENSGLIDDTINDLTFDTNGDLWVGTDRGLALFTVNESGIPQLSLSTDILPFGNVTVGGSTDRYVKLTNIGDAELIIGNQEIFGAQANAFSIVRNITAPINPFATDSIGIRFSPLAGGVSEAVLVIGSNSQTSPDTLILQGTANQAILTFSSTYLNFGQVQPHASVNLPVKVINTGSANLQISESYITDSENFEIVQGGGSQTILSGDTLDMVIGFTPLTGGAKSGDLVITSNAPSSPDTLPMIGYSALPILAINPTRLDFGRVQRYLTKMDTISMINLGDEAIVLYHANIEQRLGGNFSIANGPTKYNIAPGDTSFIMVGFSPDSVQILPDTANLVIESNSMTGLDTIQLTGRGVLFQVDPAILPNRLISGSDFSLTLSGLNILNEYYLYYKQPGYTTWDSLKFVRNNTNFTAFLEAANIPSDGLLYYIASIDIEQVKENISGGPDAAANWLSVATESLAAPATLIFKDTYGMLSIPYHLRNRNIGGVFNDEIGRYNTKLWRIFYWWYDSLNDTAFYREYNPAEALWDSEPGKAFWVITHDTTRFDIDDAISVDSRQPYQILLHKGWNQIGNPFSFPVEWSSIGIRGATVDAPVGTSHGEYIYNQTILYPWEGYFVYSNGSAELQVPPVAAPGILPKPQIRISFRKNEWTLQLCARGLSSELKDENNFVGMLDDAVDTKDKNDCLQPPPIGNVVDLYITDANLRYAANYKNISNQGTSWDIQVNSAAESELIALTFIPKTPLPDNFNLWLLDMDRGINVDVQNNQAKIAAPRRLKLIAGTADYAESQRADIPLKPTYFELKQNYPNPFNPTTMIAFQLAERTEVRLEIYNILGKRVNTLIHQVLPAGDHQLVWNGEDNTGAQCGSGLYIYRISTPLFTATKKMIRLN